MARTSKKAKTVAVATVTEAAADVAENVTAQPIAEAASVVASGEMAFISSQQVEEVAPQCAEDPAQRSGH